MPWGTLKVMYSMSPSTEVAVTVLAPAPRTPSDVGEKRSPERSPLIPSFQSTPGAAGAIAAAMSATGQSLPTRMFILVLLRQEGRSAGAAGHPRGASDNRPAAAPAARGPTEALRRGRFLNAGEIVD